MNIEIKKVPWVFIPLVSHDVSLIRGWIHRLAPTKKEDEVIAENCESILKEAFKKNKLVYREQDYGEVKMLKIRLLLGSDGICIPEMCFEAPPEYLTRIEEPLRPFIKDATRN